MPVSRIALLVVLAGVAAPTAASELPQRKSGLWEMKTGGAAMQGQSMTMQMCIDQATDDALRNTGEVTAGGQCSKVQIKRDGQRLITESTCKVENTTATTRGVFTGDFATAYKVETTTRYQPPLMGRAEDRMTIEARWLGPCKPGMKPGDMVLPGGMVVPGGMPPMGMPKK